jgi:hypothetical protein
LIHPELTFVLLDLPSSPSYDVEPDVVLESPVAANKTQATNKGTNREVSPKPNHAKILK